MMVRIGLFVMMALGLVGFGTVAWVSTRPPQVAEAAAPPPPPPPRHVKLLIAGHPLRAGSLLRPEDIDVRDMLEKNAPAGATEDSPQARGLLMGAMIRRSLGAGETLLPEDVMRPGDHGFLAAVLGAGMRAVTVGVDAVSGTAGLIWPGDRVDVILTETASNTHRQQISAMRILSDVRVIAIDQQLMQGAVANGGQPQPLARTVTLEVSGGQAERIAVATRLGSLSLAVRSAERGAVAAADTSGSVVWGTDISPQQRNEPAQPVTVRVYQGRDSKEFRF